MVTLIGLLLLFVSLTGLSQCAPSSRNLLEAEGTVLPQISRGERAHPGQFPYSVAFWASRNGKLQSTNCGGVLISESVVATTGLCLAPLFKTITDFEEWLDGETVPMYNASVRVGQTTIMEKKVPRRKVVDIKVHPSFAWSYVPVQYNLALVRLSRPVKGVRMPLLPSEAMRFKPERPVHIMGFGLVVSPGKRRPSKSLRYATMRKMSLGACEAAITQFKAITKLSLAVDLGNTTFCTGTIAGKAAYFGDLGFPVVTRGSNPVLVGLVGFSDLWSVGPVPNYVTPFNVHTDLTGELGTWAKSSIADMEAEAKEERKARRAATDRGAARESG